jgi:hypothetical protein
VPETCVKVIAEEETESSQSVKNQAQWVRAEASPPDFHRVEQGQTEKKPARDAARIFLKRFRDGTHQLVSEY